MKWPAYPSYRPSGVDWLGDVPKHWAAGNLRRFALMRTGHTPSRSEAEYWEDCEIPWFTLADVWQLREGRVYLGDTKERISRAGLANSSAELLPAGTVVLSRTASVGFSGIMPIPMATTQDFWNWLPRSNLLSEYLLYLFRAMTQVFERITMGSTHKTIYQPDAARLCVSVPPLLEQRAIADFLDAQTAKIDTLVAKKRALIEKLAEKRSALISRTVTRGLSPAAARAAGLDPRVSLTPSDTDSPGDVPEHWSVTRLKYAAARIVDCPHETPTYSPDGEYIVIRTADLTAGTADLSGAYRVDEDEYRERIRREPLLEGDIVYGREGERWGFAALVPTSSACCLGQRMMQFRVSDQFDPAFLMWQLNAACVYQQGDVDTVGATSPHVNVGTIRNYRLSKPLLNEQRAIADFLDRETAKIDALVSKVETAIDRLREYRAALITAVVTGKIDVCGALPPFTDSTPSATVATPPA